MDSHQSQIVRVYLGDECQIYAHAYPSVHMKQKIATRSGKHSTLTILTKNMGLRTVYTSEKILFVGDYKLSLATVEGLRSICFELLVRVNQGIVGCAWFIH